MDETKNSGLSGVLTHATDIVVEKGEGIYLFDTEGNRYMDFTSGIGVVNTGHCHPQELDTFFFSNSGAEAVEASVKLAKHATGKTNIIVFNGSFHGRTHLTMAMTTSKPVYRKSISLW